MVSTINKNIYLLDNLMNKDKSNVYKNYDFMCLDKYLIYRIEINSENYRVLFNSPNTTTDIYFEIKANKFSPIKFY